MRLTVPPPGEGSRGRSRREAAGSAGRTRKRSAIGPWRPHGTIGGGTAPALPSRRPRTRPRRHRSGGSDRDAGPRPARPVPRSVRPADRASRRDDATSNEHDRWRRLPPSPVISPSGRGVERKLGRERQAGERRWPRHGAEPGPTTASRTRSPHRSTSDGICSRTSAGTRSRRATTTTTSERSNQHPTSARASWSGGSRRPIGPRPPRGPADRLSGPRSLAQASTLRNRSSTDCRSTSLAVGTWLDQYVKTAGERLEMVVDRYRLLRTTGEPS